MVLAAGVPAVYKRAAWSVYNSDKDARVVELRLDSQYARGIIEGDSTCGVQAGGLVSL